MISGSLFSIIARVSIVGNLQYHGESMIKIISINCQHADIAVMQFNQIGINSVALGRAVVANCEWTDSHLPKILVDAMAYTTSDITEFDVQQLKNKSPD
jgi:hypothetical protein